MSHFQDDVFNTRGYLIRYKMLLMISTLAKRVLKLIS